MKLCTQLPGIVGWHYFSYHMQLANVWTHDLAENERAHNRRASSSLDVKRGPWLYLSTFESKKKL
jgi:hypothetical protein